MVVGRGLWRSKFAWFWSRAEREQLLAIAADSNRPTASPSPWGSDLSRSGRWDRRVSLLESFGGRRSICGNAFVCGNGQSEPIE